MNKQSKNYNRIVINTTKLSQSNCSVLENWKNWSKNWSKSQALRPALTMTKAERYRNYNSKEIDWRKKLWESGEKVSKQRKELVGGIGNGRENWDYWKMRKRIPSCKLRSGRHYVQNLLINANNKRDRYVVWSPVSNNQHSASQR